MKQLNKLLLILILCCIMCITSACNSSTSYNDSFVYGEWTSYAAVIDGEIVPTTTDKATVYINKDGAFEVDVVGEYMGLSWTKVEDISDYTGFGEKTLWAGALYYKNAYIGMAVIYETKGKQEMMFALVTSNNDVGFILRK